MVIYTYLIQIVSINRTKGEALWRFIPKLSLSNV